MKKQLETSQGLALTPLFVTKYCATQKAKNIAGMQKMFLTMILYPFGIHCVMNSSMLQHMASNITLRYF
jgi:hypothetical protein